MPQFLLDANVFIEAKNRYYGLDFCPAFWDWLIDQNYQNVLFSIEGVRDELTAREDELSVWVDSVQQGFFLPMSGEAISKLPVVSAWVASQRQYTAAAVSHFLQDTDYYIVSYALAHGCVVVTHEKETNEISRVKIPNACRGVGVQCINPFDMLRTQNVRFVLG